MKVKEETIKMMEVEFPSDLEMKQEIAAIVEKAAINKESVQRENIWKRLKQIYWGPGLRVIFYNSGMFWLVTFLLYLIIYFVFKFESGLNDENRYMMVFFGMPMSFLIFSFLSCYMDESENVKVLKQSLHYSMNYLVGLRLFYTAIAMALADCCMAGVLCSSNGKIMISFGAFGVTSTLLFAIVVLYLYHKFGSSGCFAIPGVVWVALAFGMSELSDEYFVFVFEYIPVGVHLTVSVCCFIGLILMIERLEEKDAYSFAC